MKIKPRRKTENGQRGSKDSKTLLVIEDELSISHLLRDYLSSFGYRVLTMSTARETIRQCEKGKPDMVILDVLLPDVVDKELFEDLRRRGIMTVVMSVLPKEMVANIMGTSNFLFVSKPFDLKSLLNVLQSN